MNFNFYITSIYKEPVEMLRDEAKTPVENEKRA